jgi:hypothetical protein
MTKGEPAAVVVLVMMIVTPAQERKGEKRKGVESRTACVRAGDSLEIARKGHGHSVAHVVGFILRVSVVEIN